MKCRLLVAVTTMGYVHARRALLDAFDLVPVFSVSQARIALKNGGIDGILASIHFDDSNMFELLAEVNRMDPRPPFMCCLLLRSALNERSLRGLVAAAQTQGCMGFIDYNKLHRELGSTEADKHLRQELLRVLPPPCGSKTATG